MASNIFISIILIVFIVMVVLSKQWKHKNVDVTDVPLCLDDVISESYIQECKDAGVDAIQLSDTENVVSRSEYNRLSHAYEKCQQDAVNMSNILCKLIYGNQDGEDRVDVYSILDDWEGIEAERDIQSSLKDRIKKLEDKMTDEQNAYNDLLKEHIQDLQQLTNRLVEAEKTNVSLAAELLEVKREKDDQNELFELLKEMIPDWYMYDNTEREECSAEEFDKYNKNFSDVHLAEDREQKQLEKWFLGRNKTAKEIGDDYEKTVVYRFESDKTKKWNVVAYGLINGVKDLGRDVIAECDDCVYVIQCKCWGEERPIRNNVISQLYGTAKQYEFECGKNKKVIPMLVYSGMLDDTAKHFADSLNVRVVKREQKDLGIYPMIKCNINARGDKIYHLPFDRHYMRTKIDKRGEFMALTVKEAKSKGFRRTNQ